MIYIKIHNFVQFQDVELGVPSRYHLLYGENQTTISNSSNGSGKSLFVDSIVYALYGQSLRGGNLDQLVGEYDDTMSVEITLPVRKGDLRVYRSRSPNVLKAWLNGEPISLHKKSDMQDSIDSILGMDFQVFLKCGYYGEFSVSLLSMTASSRAQHILSIMGYDESTHLNEDTNLKARVRELEREVSALEQEDTFCSAEIERIGHSPWPGQEAADKAVTVAKSKLASVTARYTSLLDSKKKMDISHLTWTDRSSRFVAIPLEMVDVKYTELVEENTKRGIFLDSLSVKRSTILQNIYLTKKDLEDALDNTYTKYWNDIVECGNTINGHKSAFSSESSRNADNERQLSKSRKTLSDGLVSMSNNICPVCGNDIDQKHRDSFVSSLNEEIAVLESNSAKFQEKLDELSKLIEKANNEKQVLVTSLQEEIESIYGTLLSTPGRSIEREVVVKNMVYQPLVLLKKDLANIESEIRTESEVSKRIKDELESFENAKFKSAKAIDEFSKLSASIEEAIENGKVVRKEYEWAVAQFDDAKRLGVEQVERDIERLLKKRESIAEELSTKRDIITIGTLSRKYLSEYKKAKTAEFVNRLEGRMNYFLQEMQSLLIANFTYSEGAIDIAFTDPSKNESLQYYAFSRGERTRIRKAFFWLMVDLFKPPIVLADESNDGLDEEGLKGVLEFASKRFDSIPYIEVSPIEFVFDGSENIPVLQATKKRLDNATLITVNERQ